MGVLAFGFSNQCQLNHEEFQNVSPLKPFLDRKLVNKVLLTNILDPDEMPQNVPSYMGLHCWSDKMLFMGRNMTLLGNLTCVPLIYLAK